MLPTPDIPLNEYEVARAQRVAHIRAAIAAVAIFVICALVLAAHL